MLPKVSIDQPRRAARRRASLAVDAPDAFEMPPGTSRPPPSRPYGGRFVRRRPGLQDSQRLAGARDGFLSADNYVRPSESERPLEKMDGTTGANRGRRLEYIAAADRPIAATLDISRGQLETWNSPDKASEPGFKIKTTRRARYTVGGDALIRAVRRVKLVNLGFSPVAGESPSFLLAVLLAQGFDSPVCRKPSPNKRPRADGMPSFSFSLR